ncbi:MAG: hypothetical protein ACXWR1_18685 [Bdellovibrionota bacterium]
MRFLALTAILFLGTTSAHADTTKKAFGRKLSSQTQDCDKILTQLAAKTFSNCVYTFDGGSVGPSDVKITYAKNTYNDGSFFGALNAAINDEGGWDGFGLFEIGVGSKDQIQCKENLINFKTEGGRTGSIALNDKGSPTMVRKMGKDVQKITCP